MPWFSGASNCQRLSGSGSGGGSGLDSGSRAAAGSEAMEVLSADGVSDASEETGEE